MNQIIKNYYTLALRLTGTRSIAYFAALSFVSILSIITIKGLAVLLSDILPTGIIVQLLTPPYMFFTGTGIFLLNMWAAPQSRFVVKENTSTLSYSKVAISIAIPLVVCAYLIISHLMQ